MKFQDPSLAVAAPDGVVSGPRAHESIGAGMDPVGSRPTDEIRATLR